MKEDQNWTKQCKWQVVVGRRDIEIHLLSQFES